MADISKIKIPNGTTYNIKDPVSYNKVISRGEQLVVNGSGMLGDNTNFSSWTFDGSQANSSAGSFTRTGGYADIGTDEFFPVDASKKYRFEFDLKSSSNVGTMYAMLLFYDVDKYSVSAGDHMYYSGTLTTLTQDLKAGDTVVHLADVSNYKTYGTSSHQRALKFWDYRNTFGYLYPPETYSRNTLWSAWTDDNSINKTNNTITLATAYTGATKPAGTYVSQGNSGGTYKYSAIVGSKVPTEWTHYVGYFNGTDYSGRNLGEKFPPATAYAKVGFLWNYNSSSDQFWVTNVSVKEVPIATDAVDYGGTDTGLGNSTPATNAKTYYLDDSKVTTLRPKVYYNTSGTEYTTLFAKGSSNGNYGTILKWGHGDKYLRMLRRNNGNWSSDDWEKIDAGNADTATSTQRLASSTQVTGTTVNDFKGTTTRVAPAKSISITGLAGSDGVIIWLPWNSNYGRQFIFDDTTQKIFSRYLNNGTWGDWKDLSDAEKVNSHTVDKDVPSDAVFTDTTYESKAAASGGTAVSLVTTGEKYTWNNKSTVPTNHASSATTYGTGTSSNYGHLKLSDSTSSTSGTSGGIAATPSAVKTAYDLADSANTTAGTALSGVNGNLIYDHTFTISNGVATFVPHVYQKGAEVTTNYAKSCFAWKYRLIDGTEVDLPTLDTRGCSVTITDMGYGGHVIGIFTPT